MISSPPRSPVLERRADSPTFWRRAGGLFDRLAPLDTPAREEALDRARDLDPKLCGAVEELLEHDLPDAFLEIPWSPPVEAAPAVRPPEEGWVGSCLGPYRLVREIGRGGSGIVFLAEREDPGRHRVAVKILSSAPGPEARLRFRRERLMLARLRHPHIARSIGGGMTPEGLLYTLMELIDGLPITTYCDRRRLSIERRLELFCDLCSAVQHAHLHRIVHRDLKPSNVLVTRGAQVKLLDFGIATRLADADRPFGWMTPAYASPEQILGREVSTASDVYSLGVLLYELLSGRRPHDASPDEPSGWFPSAPVTPPSQAWDHEDGSQHAGESAAMARGLSIGQLGRRLRGDLDHIVLRALRDQPERRWTSAEDMASRLRRHLTGHSVPCAG